MIKVLWIAGTPCSSINRYGVVKPAEGWIASLEAELHKRTDIQLSVAYTSEIKEEPFDYENVHYYPLYMPKGGKIQRWLSNFDKTIGEKRAKPLLRRLINECHPDIIHVHGTEGWKGRIIEMIEGVPVVFSIQGMIAPYCQKYFAGIPKHDAFRLDPLLDRILGFGIRTTWKSFQYRGEREINYIKNNTYVFGRTFWDYDCTLAINPNRQYYIVNEILRPIFYEKQWKGYIEKSGKYTVQIISTVSGGIYKGLETLLKAAYILISFSQLNFEWHVVGYSDSTKWVAMAEKLTKIKSSNVHVIYHGRLQSDDLCNMLVNSDIYVHVSHIENSPNSVCEAMLLGMPIIASFTGGTASLLTHEKEGVLYQDGDPYVLAGAILDFIQHPKKAIEYGSAARKRAVLRHNKEKIVSEVVSGYMKIIEDFKYSRNIK